MAPSVSLNGFIPLQRTTTTTLNNIVHRGRFPLEFVFVIASPIVRLVNVSARDATLEGVGIPLRSTITVAAVVVDLGRVVVQLVGRLESVDALVTIHFEICLGEVVFGPLCKKLILNLGLLHLLTVSTYLEFS